MHFFKSLRFQIAIAFFAVVIFAILVLNVYPSTALTNLLIEAKKGEMLERGFAVTTVLQSINYENADGVSDAVQKIIDKEKEDIVVLSSTGQVIYATGKVEEIVDEKFEESYKSALLGFDAFNCVYDETSFRSSITMPIMHQTHANGIVYISQTDADDSKLLVDIRNSFISISIAIAVCGGTLVAMFIKMFSSKVSALLKGVHQVGSGNYNYKIKADGGDEFSQIAQEFNMLSEKLQSVEKIRQEFVSNASHELKTPLASIKLLSDSIVQTQHMSKEDTLDFLRDINAEIDRLIRITENLLYITKNDSRPVVTKEVCNVSKIAERCRELLAGKAGHLGVEIKVRATDDCRVIGNGDMLYQVIFNIMENAVKYNREDGAVLVTIEKSGEECVTTISDTGIGMADEERDKIFERFYRIDKARSRSIGGTGLGLSIVKDNIELMNGSIEVESELGKGSTFIIKMPLAKN